MVEEMWPRYGSFPGFNPIVELSLTFHNLVVGANGQRQAMFLENVPGLATQILRNFDLSDVDIENLDTPVAPGSTVGYCMLINCIKAELANLLTQAGHPPRVLTAGALIGAERATELFQAAYDEHAHRIAQMYKKVGIPSYVSEQNL